MAEDGDIQRERPWLTSTMILHGTASLASSDSTADANAHFSGDFTSPFTRRPGRTGRRKVTQNMTCVPGCRFRAFPGQPPVATPLQLPLATPPHPTPKKLGSRRLATVKALHQSPISPKGVRDLLGLGLQWINVSSILI